MGSESNIETSEFVKANKKSTKVNSDLFFYDNIYQEGGSSAQLLIPDTLIFEQNGNKTNMVRYWLFNPKKKLKGKVIKILRKSKSTVSSLDSMFLQFTGRL